MPRPERPLEPDGSPLTDFAVGLRRVRQDAGGPTYRELARQAGYSAATLSDAAGGRRLPSLDVTLAYVRACGGDANEWELRWHTTAASLNAVPLPRQEPINAPYTGLAAFRVEDADLFFGRERLSVELRERLSEHHFVTVFGASGSGKSSLLHAGLAAHVTGPVVVCTPGEHPFDQLAPFTRSTADELAASPRNLQLALRQVLVGHPEGTELVLVVDQFEEVFTLCADAGERGAFIAALAAAADGRCRVVLGVRADFYAHCTAYPELVESKHVTVGPMTPEELRRAIAKPAATAGCAVESALLAHLVATVHGSAGMLPLLAHALLETWRRRQGTTLTLAGFQASGGINGALAKTAETVFTDLDSHQKALTRNLFRRLTAPGDGTEDTKRRVRAGELGDDPGLAVVLDRLTEARLLVRDNDTVEITHEALIRAWPRLRDWLGEDREGLRAHRQLTEAARQWESLDHDPSLLFRGTRLALARESTAALNASEQAFLDASVEAHETEEALARKRTRRLRQLVGLLTVVVLLLGVAVFVAIDAQRDALRERNIAVSRQAVREAERLRADDPALAARISLAAYRLDPSRDAKNSLLSAHAATRWRMGGRPLTASLPSSTTPPPSVPSSPPPPSASPVQTDYLMAELSNTYPVLSADTSGTRIATGGDQLIIWGAPCSQGLCELGRIDGPASAVAFGDNIVAATSGHTTKLWQVTNPKEPQLLETFVHDAQWAAFSRDGKMFATGSESAPVSLWDISSPAEPRRLGYLPLSTGDHWGAFGPGKLFATTNTDGTLTTWDVADPARAAKLQEVTRHPGAHRRPVFSADGRRLAALSSDRSVTVWSIDQRVQLQEEADLAAQMDVSWLSFVEDRSVRGHGKGQTTTWELDVERVAQAVCGDGTFRPDQWDRYFPGMPYQPGC